MLDSFIQTDSNKHVYGYIRIYPQTRENIPHDLRGPRSVRKENGTIRNAFPAWRLCLNTATKSISRVGYFSFRSCYRLSPLKDQLYFTQMLANGCSGYF